MNIKSIALIFMSFIVRASILAIAILVVFKTGQKAYDFGFRIFTEEAMSPEPGRDVAVTIVQGDSTTDVGKMLEVLSGIINCLWCRISARFMMMTSSPDSIRLIHP